MKKRPRDDLVTIGSDGEPPPRRTIPVIGNSVVYVGRGLLDLIPSELTPQNGIKASRFVIVSDEHVWPLYGERLVRAFLALGNVVQPGGDADAGDGKRLLLSYQARTSACFPGRARGSLPSRRTGPCGREEQVP